MENGMSTISRGDICIQGLSDKEMEFQLIRQLGSSAYCGASIGECLNIAAHLPNCSPEEWVKEFSQLAKWQQKDGMERLTAGHVISGKEQLLRACNSFRAAEYYSSCFSEQHSVLGLHSADCFALAISCMDVHFENYAIPYKDINLPVYFISPENDGKKRKTLMIVSGFDGTMEEEFIMRGLAAVQRGYNVIHFAGPGQMDVFRNYPNTYFEPDFGHVVQAIINHFEFRQEIDLNNLFLMGVSLGGYFATRAACFEPRIKALIANSPILDLSDYLSSFVPTDPCEIPDSEDFGVEDLASIPNEIMSPQLKVQTEQLIIRFGQKTFKNTFLYLKQFTVNDVIKSLDIPCLALIGAAEGKEPQKQFEMFCEFTGANHYKFSNFEGASGHCQVGNISFANAIVYDWLDDL